ncbi:MAG: tetratricopeptide repeat protein [Afipia sp.]|nr:tetratricopeptide repeat protein [Afipia sp.]
MNLIVAMVMKSFLFILLSATVQLSASSTSFAQSLLDRCVNSSGDAAIAACSQAISREQKNAAAYFARGNAWYRKKEYTKAISDYDQAIAISPIDASSFYNRGAARSRIGQIDKALADIDEAIRLSPNFVDAYKLRASLRAAEGETDKAIADYTEVIKLRPDASAYSDRATLFYSKFEFERARADYDEAIRLEPDNIDSLFSRGKAKGELNDDSALQDFDKVIALRPNEASAFAARGVFWAGKGETNKAIVDFDKALTLNPQYFATYLVRSDLWIEKREFEKAIADIEQALKINSKSAEAYSSLGRVYAGKGELAKSIEILTKAIELDPNSQDGYAFRGYARAQSGDCEKAILDFDQALKLSSQKDSSAFNARGYCWSKSGAFDKAISDLSSAISLDNQFARAFENRGTVWYSKADYDKAIADYREALRIEPGNSDVSEKLQLAIEKKVQPAAPKQNAFIDGKRVALIIGNAEYQNIGVLPNASRDARLFAKALRDVGFTDVSESYNLTREQMMKSLANFSKLAYDADWAAIYFAGHGVEILNTNYLLAADAKISTEQDVSKQAVNLDYFLNAVESAGRLRLVILDACRNNPFADNARTVTPTRGLGTTKPGTPLVGTMVGVGLGRVEPKPGTLVIYSAKNGQVALDGEGENSPFTKALVKRIEQKPPIEVRRLFDFVRKDVFDETKQAQQPFAYGSLEPTDDFYFSR